jgi:TIR domain-containing protein/putative peptidoglycan binding protein
MNDLVVDRFEKYFRHPDWGHDVLRLGDRCNACANVRRATAHLLDRYDDGGSKAKIFDEELQQQVKDFQERFRHRVADGEVGPGTRRLITKHLLAGSDPSLFNRYFKPETSELPCVFISYAWKDEEKVHKLVQWLRDREIKVILDADSFIAGETVRDSIRRAVAEADKVVAVFSENSKDRDWPQFERAIAEQLESVLGQKLLIYLCLDDTPLPEHDNARLAIAGGQKPLKSLGNKILETLTGSASPMPRVPYDEDEPL